MWPLVLASAMTAPAHHLMVTHKGTGDLPYAVDVNMATLVGASSRTSWQCACCCVPGQPDLTCYCNCGKCTTSRRLLCPTAMQQYKQQQQEQHLQQQQQESTSCPPYASCCTRTSHTPVTYTGLATNTGRTEAVALDTSLAAEQLSSAKQESFVLCGLPICHNTARKYGYCCHSHYMQHCPMLGTTPRMCVLCGVNPAPPGDSGGLKCLECHSKHKKQQQQHKALQPVNDNKRRRVPLSATKQEVLPQQQQLDSCTVQTRQDIATDKENVDPSTKAVSGQQQEQRAPKKQRTAPKQHSTRVNWSDLNTMEALVTARENGFGRPRGAGVNAWPVEAVQIGCESGEYANAQQLSGAWKRLCSKAKPNQGQAPDDRSAALYDRVLAQVQREAGTL